MRVVRQDAIPHNSLPLVLDTLLGPAQGDIKAIAEVIKDSEEFNLDIYEVMVAGKELQDKTTKNNRLAALFHNKSSSNKNIFALSTEVETHRVLYNLAVFHSLNLNTGLVNLVRVEVTMHRVRRLLGILS